MGPQENLIKNLSVFLLLLLAGLGAYWNSFHSPFIWDDPYLITRNHLVTSFRYLPEAFTHHLYYSTAGVSNFYRPLQTFFLTVDYAIWKTEPFGYHLTSFLFHLLTAWMIYQGVLLLFRRRGVALLTSLLFVVHPIHSTVVNYIASRADSQAAFFMLLSLWLFFKSLPQDAVQGREGKEGRRQKAESRKQKQEAGSRKLEAGSLKPGFLAGSLVAFVLALLSKELAVIFPLLLLFCVWVLKKQALRHLIPFFALLGIYGALRLTVLNFHTVLSGGYPPLGVRLLTTCEAFVRLIGSLFVPTKIHIEKAIPFLTQIWEPRAVLSIAALIGIAVGMGWARRRSEMVFFGLGWFFIALLPMANLVPINANIADHWLYLPSLGLFIAVIGGVSDGIRRLSVERQRWARRLGLSCFVIVMVFFSSSTLRQNTIWADPVRFFELALEYSPKSFRAHNELGVLHLEEKRYTLAAERFEAAIRINPNFDQAYDNLGVALDHQGRLDLAVEKHLKAIELNDHNIKAYNNLGNAYYKSEKWEKAIQAYQEALRLNPDYKAVYNNLGAVYFKTGRFAQAKKMWEKTLRIDPNFEMAEKNLKILEEFVQKQKRTQGAQPLPGETGDLE